jgi:hypothetical protein
MRKGERHRCDRCGAEAWSDAQETRNWDWFRCYLGRTYHYCPQCKAGEEARAMFAKSRIKPSNVKFSGEGKRSLTDSAGT